MTAGEKQIEPHGCFKKHVFHDNTAWMRMVKQFMNGYKQSPAIRGGFIRGFSYKGRQIHDSPYSESP